MSPIKQFQQENNLVADGILGPITLGKMQQKFGISNKSHLAHYMGQAAHETMNFKSRSENLHYSSAGLQSIFWKYFPNAASTNGYSYKPEKIANKVYANRGGNGDEASGDGWKFRGRGSIQTTLKDNYSLLAGELKDPCIMENPDLVSTTYFFESGLQFFERNKIWRFCGDVSEEKILKVSRAINLGNPYSSVEPNGLQDRLDKTRMYYEMLTR